MLTVYSQGIRIREDGTYEGIAAFRGEAGATGPAGAPGADGVSPGVTVSAVTGGHRVTITDRDHPGGQTFEVMDGVNAVNADWDESDPSSRAYIENKPGLAAVATSGSYTDLSDRPAIPSMHESWTFTLSDGTTVTKEAMLWQST